MGGCSVGGGGGEGYVDCGYCGGLGQGTEVRSDPSPADQM